MKKELLKENKEVTEATTSPAFNTLDIKESMNAKDPKMISLIIANSFTTHTNYLVESMATECKKYGYELNVFYSKDKQSILDTILNPEMAGVALLAGEFIKEEEIENFKKQNIKAVFLDQEVKNSNIGSVLYDFYNSGYALTTYLIKNGHKKIIYIAKDQETYENTQCQKGYTSALEEYNMFLSFDSILKVNSKKEKSMNTIKRIINQSSNEFPDAFVAENELCAIETIQAIESEGYSVPQDVSVVSLNDGQMAKNYEIPLTTITNEFPKQGIVSTQHLIDLINNKVEGKIEKITGEIIPRESSQAR